MGVADGTPADLAVADGSLADLAVAGGTPADFLWDVGRHAGGCCFCWSICFPISEGQERVIICGSKLHGPG